MSSRIDDCGLDNPSRLSDQASEALVDDLTSDLRPPTSDLKWYVIQSKPREEVRAQHFLAEKGFHAFLPRMEIIQTRGFKSSIKEKPLFPGYLFCRFEASDERLVQVRWTKGVVNILPESVNPTPVEDEIVNAIRTLEEKDGVIRKRGLQKNDQIRIARGPMKDILGIFDHWTSDQGRVRVLLNFISYHATVVLHHSLVERVA